MCGASFSTSPWARLSSFWLALLFALVQVPVIGQSTNSGPPQSESSQSEGWPLSKVSSELLNTLKDLKNKYPKTLEESESLRDKVKSLSEQLTTLSSQSATWEAESKRLTDLVKFLTLEFEDYQKAAEDRAKKDQKAIDQARAERDRARESVLWAVILSLLAGAGIGFMF